MSGRFYDEQYWDDLDRLWPEGDTWEATWLDRTYDGAPDECGQCFRNGKIVKWNNCKEHTES